MGFYKKLAGINHIYKYNNNKIGASHIFFLPYGYIDNDYNNCKIVKLNCICSIISIVVIGSIFFTNTPISVINFILIVGGIALNYLCSYYIPNAKYIEENNYTYFWRRAFHNNIKFLYNKEYYEIYSHGNNQFSIMKGEIQIALIKIDDYIIMGERKFKCSYLSEYIDREFLFMLLMYIDRTFLKQNIGIKYCSVFHKSFTFNFNDVHKERLLFIGDTEL